MLTESHSPGVYSTMDFDAHPLSESTILDNRAAVHLVNNLQLIEPGSFVKASGIDCVEAGTQSFPILGKGTRRIRSILNGVRGERTEDLILRDMAVVERFHVNIVSEARLDQVGLWYLGLDTTLRMGTLEQNIVLAKLRREHNLTFIEYKPLMLYPTVMSVTHDNRRNRSWTIFLRSDSAELWHSRAGHLGAEALEALVKSARNVRIKGIPRSKCEHCATTHARQVISRRPRERSPRPYWRISWDLFDMPKGRSGELWILLIKCDFSGKLHAYSLQAKTLNEIMRTCDRCNHARQRRRNAPLEGNIEVSDMGS
ncbi:hypothetical protein PTNB85_05612 [Pyrenophora teres f. teres]|nr:hypothetical protein PTNB85_05612 [Pyrenophora teres f. teres]